MLLAVPDGSDRSSNLEVFVAECSECFLKLGAHWKRFRSCSPIHKGGLGLTAIQISQLCAQFHGQALGDSFPDSLGSTEPAQIS